MSKACTILSMFDSRIDNLSNVVYANFARGQAPSEKTSGRSVHSLSTYVCAEHFTVSPSLSNSIVLLPRQPLQQLQHLTANR